jgi:hypothetical protein
MKQANNRLKLTDRLFLAERLQLSLFVRWARKVIRNDTTRTCS